MSLVGVVSDSIAPLTASLTLPGLVVPKTLLKGDDRRMEGEIVSYACLKEP